MTATEQAAPSNGRANTTVVGPPRRLASSAARIQLGNKKVAKAQAGARQEWQSEAYEYFDDIGMVKFGIRFRGNQMAKLRLYPAIRPVDDPEAAPVPLNDPESGVSADLARRCQAEIERIKGASGGTPEILRLLDMNVEIAGECFIVGIGPRVKIERDAEGNDVEVLVLESWDVVSVRYFEKTGDDIKVKIVMNGELKTITLDPTLDTCVRIWQRHPAYSDLSDCNMRAVLGDCESLVLLTNEVKAESKSNQSNGILFIPNTMSVTTPSRTSPADEDADPDAIDAYPETEEVGAASIGDALEDAIMEPISDPSSAWSVWPLIVIGPAEDGDKIRHIELHRDASTVLEERIAQRKEAIAQGLNLPIEVMKGHQQTTFCADPETEILTRDGWRRYESLHVGDQVLTLNHRTGLSEWQPAEFVHAFEVEDEPMLALNGKSHNSLTTASHRWPILDLFADRARRWQTSGALLPSHQIITAAQQAVLPTDAKYSDEFVEVVAWHWTEGHVHRGGGEAGVVTLSQSGDVNPQYCERIRGVLTRLLGAPQKDLRGKRGRGAAWAERRDRDRNMRRFILSRTITTELEAVAPRKVVSPEFVRSLTAAQLELFIDVSLMADGTRTNMGSRVITQSKSEMLDAIEFATILSGRTPCRWQSATGSYSTFHLAISDRTIVGVPQKTARRSPNHAHREWVSYTGTVWCPTTRNGSWMARRNGKVYFTGNSNAEVIDRDIYAKHLEPSAVLLCDMWTIGLLRPALVDAGVAPEIAERIIVWFDPAALLESVDPTEKVAEALALDLISDEAARRLWGMSEDDAPTAIDRLIRAILKQQAWDPALVDAVIRALDPSLDVPEPTEEPVVASDGLSTEARALIASLARTRTDGLSRTARSDLLVDLLRYRDSGQTLRASAKPRTTAGKAGERLAAIDRDLQTKTLAVANSAMTRALERAGNRLKAKAGPTRETLRAVAPIYAAQQMGPSLVASAGLADEDLIDADAFESTISQFHTWGKHAQASALAIAASLAGLTAAQRKQLMALQAQHLNDSTEWMRGQLHALAGERLYQPDEREPAFGEFDPSSRVPAGLVRLGIAIAGGATALEFTATNPRDKYVALASDKPPGGIGTGELLTNAITESGAIVILGYEWDYGEEYRFHPYEPHESLSGEVQESAADFPGDDFSDPAFPGNHGGCACQPLIPVYAERADVTGGSAGTGLDAPGADLFGEGD